MSVISVYDTYVYTIRGEKNSLVCPKDWWHSEHHLFQLLHSHFVCLAVLTQYTNVTDRHCTAAEAALMHSIARKKDLRIAAAWRVGRVTSAVELASRRLRQLAVDRQADGPGVQAVREVGRPDRRQGGRVLGHGGADDARPAVRLAPPQTRGRRRQTQVGRVPPCHRRVPERSGRLCQVLRPDGRGKPPALFT